MCQRWDLPLSETGRSLGMTSAECRTGEVTFLSNKTNNAAHDQPIVEARKNSLYQESTPIFIDTEYVHE